MKEICEWELQIGRCSVNDTTRMVIQLTAKEIFDEIDELGTYNHRKQYKHDSQCFCYEKIKKEWLGEGEKE